MYNRPRGCKASGMNLTSVSESYSVSQSPLYPGIMQCTWEMDSSCR